MNVKPAITRKLMTLMIVLFVVTGTRQSFAEVQLLSDEGWIRLIVRGEITKSDADYVAQHEADFSKDGHWWVELNSVGGDVAAAMKIGRILRDMEAHTTTAGECLSSCALIFIAGVSRDNAPFGDVGVIGLHRPFLAASSLSRDVVERAAPLMLQRIRDYIHEMGVSDAFYDAMVNTEVSDVRLYRGDEIYRLVPRTDPTHDEIDNAYEARRYGISAAEMRQRERTKKERCYPLWLEANHRPYFDCLEATLWGLDIATYRRLANNPNIRQCALSDEETKIFHETDFKKRRDLPFVLKSEACMRDEMNRDPCNLPFVPPCDAAADSAYRRPTAPTTGCWGC
jgi:hypothetical protein